MRFPPDRAGWIVVTRNYRLAVGLAVSLTVAAALCAYTVIRDVVRDRPIHWSFALMLLATVIWAVRLLGNVLWLRRDTHGADGSNQWR